MPPVPTFRPEIIEARRLLAEGRSNIWQQHEAGSPGFQVCTRMTDLIDRVVLMLYRAALESESNPTLESLMTLVPHGGFGRRDLAPYSDVDLMLLVEPGSEQRLRDFVRRFTQSIYDVGLDLGWSLRTVAETRVLAHHDATILTSLTEARYLAGGLQRFTTFVRQFQRSTQQRSAALLAAIQQAREEEQRQYGETVYLLQPNIKRSRGGLRDIQLVRWIGFARYGMNDWDRLEQAGYLPQADRRKLRGAHEYLLRLRNELHFHAGKAQDLLDKREQLRLAERFGHPGNEHQLPVEQFMRDYIEHTSDVSYVVSNLLSNATQRNGVGTLTELLLSHRVGADLRVGPRQIGATKRGLRTVPNSLAEILRLMDLSNRYRNRIDHRTWQAIRERMIHGPQLEYTPVAIERFLSLLSEPGRLGTLLRRLHELRVLEKLIPPMAHARCLMQFNDYHKYTVDEHSIRAVECATQFLDNPDTVGQVYRSLKQKRTLHLALLLHDLGKGFPEDHSEVGERLAEETARHLGLPDDETETIKLLVRKHLLMSDLAQRRNIDDESVVVQLAVEVESPEQLKMLYVLTCADLAAVGPGVLTSWKQDLLKRLYFHTLEQLAGDPAASPDVRLVRRRADLRQLIGKPDAWWETQINALPLPILSKSKVSDIASRLSQLRDLPRDEVRAWGRFLPERQALEYMVGAHEDAHVGIFHRLTGALTSQGLRILSAEINTLPDQLVLDSFYVEDLDFSGEPPADRIAAVTEALVQVLLSPVEKPPTFRRTWAAQQDSAALEAVRCPTRVRVDNSTSERFTILDIFCHDRMGLLYTITHTIFQLHLSVHFAKIGTHLDQVVDVFYVIDEQGNKITDPRRIELIRQRLLEAIDQLRQP
jgi:[protein-PII] uridylyltransferase